MRTRHRLLHIFATLATFAVVWLVAVPARAAAPLCDPRGASAFAPPPQLQEEQLSFDIRGCDPQPDDATAGKHVVPGRSAPQLDGASSHDPTTAASAVVPPAAPVARLHAEAPAPMRAPHGVRQSVERPPRR